MKRIFTVFLCVCIMLSFIPTALADPAESEAYYFDAVPEMIYEPEPMYEPENFFDTAFDPVDEPDDDWEDNVDVEDYFEEVDTIYDLEDEEDVELIPEEEPPPEEDEEGKIGRAHV